MRQIQETVVAAGERKADFVGGRDWIGTNEAGRVLDADYDVGIEFNHRSLWRDCGETQPDKIPLEQSVMVEAHETERKGVSPRDRANTRGIVHHIVSPCRKSKDGRCQKFVLAQMLPAPPGRSTYPELRCVR